MATDTPMTIIAATTTAASAHFSTWSDGILVDASAILTSTNAILYITTDGTTPTASNFNYVMFAGQVAIVANRQPKLNSLQYAGNAGLDYAGNANGVGITSQTVPASLYTGTGTTGTGYPTWISILSSVASAGNVGVEQR
jgi:hypothetical protein